MNTTRKDNIEIKTAILNALASLEYTHTYAFGIREHGMVKAAIVENADEILPLITIAEQQASSHNSVWGIRMHGTTADFALIKSYAREVIDICSVKAFEQANGLEIPYDIVERRPGDIAECYADPALAEKELGWKAKYGIKEMCEDSWRWQSQNPNGFED